MGQALARAWEMGQAWEMALEQAWGRAWERAWGQAWGTYLEQASLMPNVQSSGMPR
jgi:hypothetical protein